MDELTNSKTNLRTQLNDDVVGRTMLVMTEKSLSVTKDLLIAVLLDKFGNKASDGRSVSIDITSFIKAANEYKYPISISVSSNLKQVTISSKYSD